MSRGYSMPRRHQPPENDAVGESPIPQSRVVPRSPMGLTNPGKSTSSAPDAWALVLRTFTPVFHASRATQAVTTKPPFCPVRPRPLSTRTRRCYTDALKCA